MFQDLALRSTIEALGSDIGPQVLQRCQSLFDAEQRRLAATLAPAAMDLEYGSHPRHRLDIYAPPDLVPGVSAPVPVFVWVHGGGFTRGEKNSSAHPFNAHVGRWIAGHGYVGVVINYRLAPESGWPGGGEDVGSAIDWLQANIARFGGDPQRIVLAGTSAGSVHNATYLQLRPQAQVVCGLVLLSGFYGFTPPGAQDRSYFGAGELPEKARTLHAAVADSSLPLFVACAQFDPPRFQAETLGLLSAVLRARGRLPYSYIANGQNHYTMAMHLGTQDTRLADEILAFADECTGR